MSHVFTRNRSLVLVLVLVALAAATVFATLPAAAQSASTGRVRVMHASPDTPPVDIFVDGQKAVTALAFPNNTGYVALPAGSRNVKVFVSPSDGTGSPALEANLNVAAGTDYTVLAVGEVGKGSLALLPLQDNNALPAAGNAHVRIIHAGPDAPAVDVAVAGTTTKLFSDIEFKEVGTYTPVPAGTYNLEVRPAGTTTVALAINGLQLANRTVYTVVATGLLANNTLRAVPLVDAQPAAAPGTPNTGTGLAASGSASSWLLAAGALALAAGVAGGAVALRRARTRA
jgi:hypothetical protein